MSTWKGIVDKTFTPDTLKTYVNGITITKWKPVFITLHNTGAPNLTDKPNGLTENSIQNLQTYYRDTNKWSAGPHFFCDDKQIWAFTPLTEVGVHAPGWNFESIGIEMLGDYSHDDFNSGRGLLVQQNAIACVAIISHHLGINPTTMRLHKEDPQTTHKDCPGKSVNKAAFIKGVQDYIAKNLHS